MDYDNKIIENVNKLMRDNGITQAALAKIVGSQQSRINKILKGDAGFNICQLIAISQHFGISLDELVGNGRKESKEKGRFETFSDIFEALIDMEEVLDIDIVDIPGVYCQCSQQDRYGVHFRRENVQIFLGEWKTMLATAVSVTNGWQAYETWKNGVLRTYDYPLDTPELEEPFHVPLRRPPSASGQRK